MLIGYARVSTEDQSLDRQIDQLKEAGCEKIFQEKMTGTRKDRPELQKLLEFAREGDTIVVTELTRLSRSTKDLIALVEELNKRGVNLKSLKESWLDTTTAQGKLFFTIMAGLAQFERDLISERTKEGLKSARARGRMGGRPKVDQKAIERALKLYEAGNMSIKEICEVCKISKSTLYNYINEKKTKEKQETAP